MAKSFNIPSQGRSPNKSGLSLPSALPSSKPPVQRTGSPAFVGRVTKKSIPKIVSIPKPVSIREDGEWILYTGVWRDEGEWIDTENWIDS